MSAPALLPVSLLTGFLGSGKTTLINRLLKHPGMERSAVLVNEFGEIGLDHHLIEKIDEETVLLNAGCLCCSIRGDLARALADLSVRHFKGEIPPLERVLIESTGLADPAPILHTLMSDPVVSERFRLDGVIATVDSVNGADQLARQPEPVKQAAVADRIVITKCDLAGAAAIDALTANLAALNPSAPIHRAIAGEIDLALLFGAGLYNPETKSLDVRQWLRDEAYRDDHHHAHDVNRHDAHIGACCIRITEPLEWAVFVAWIRALIAERGSDLLRIKGIVSIAGQDRPIVVHGVQHLFHDPVPLPQWPDGDRSSRIIFITRDLSEAEIRSKLEGLRPA